MFDAYEHRIFDTDTGKEERFTWGTATLEQKQKIANMYPMLKARLDAEVIPPVTDEVDDELGEDLGEDKENDGEDGGL